MVDVLIINDEEARQLSKEYSLVKASKVIRAMGPKYLIIKKGEHGALLFHGDKVFFAPALPLEDVLIPQEQEIPLPVGSWDTLLLLMILHLKT